MSNRYRVVIYRLSITFDQWISILTGAIVGKLVSSKLSRILV